MAKLKFMKKTFLIGLLLITLGFGANAQRYGIIDSKYILEKMSEYTDAQGKLDNLSKVW